MKLIFTCAFATIFAEAYIHRDSIFELKLNKLLKVVKSGACHHIYLDLGTNIGIQIRKLFQPESYEKASVLRYYFKLFGSNRNNVCAIGFEANPLHTDRLQMVEKAYNDAGFPCTIFTETAVSSTERNMTFHMDGQAHPTQHQWGASLEYLSPIHKNGENVTVRAIDMNSFFLKVFKVWTQSSNYVPKRSKVMVKVDVEGSEHELLPNLLAGGSLCKMNLVTLEWHQKRGEDIEPHLRKVFSRLKNCHIDMINFDDESYGQGNDTVPFPSPIHS